MCPCGKPSHVLYGSFCEDCYAECKYGETDTLASKTYHATEMIRAAREKDRKKKPKKLRKPQE